MGRCIGSCIDRRYEKPWQRTRGLALRRLELDDDIGRGHGVGQLLLLGCALGHSQHPAATACCRRLDGAGVCVAAWSRTRCLNPLKSTSRCFKRVRRSGDGQGWRGRQRRSVLAWALPKTIVGRAALDALGHLYAAACMHACVCTPRCAEWLHRCAPHAPCLRCCLSRVLTHAPPFSRALLPQFYSSGPCPRSDPADWQALWHPLTEAV